MNVRRWVARGPQTIKSVADDLRGDGRGRILTAVAFGWFLGIGIRLAVPALVPHIRTDFGIGLQTAGILLSVLWITYALFQLPGGIAGDRFGERPILAGSAAIAVVGLVAAAIAPTVLALFGGIVLLGIGTGLYATTRFTILSDIYPKRAGTALGVSAAAGNVGTVILPFTAGVLAAAFSWRMGFAAVAPLFAFAILALWTTVPARTSGTESAVDELSIETVKQVIRGISNRRALVFATAMFLMSFVYQGFTSFYPTYLADVKGLHASSAAALYSVFFATGIILQPIGGAAADRLGERSTMMACTALSAIALALLTVAEGFLVLLVVSMFLSTQLAFWPIAQAAVIDALPTDMQGTGFGFLRTAYLLLAASAPTIIGSMAERAFFDEAFLVLAVASALTVGLGLLLTANRP